MRDLNLCEMAGLRKTWDKAEYEAKAVARLERGDDIEDDRAKLKRKRAPEEAKEEFRMAAPGLKLKICCCHTIKSIIFQMLLVQLDHNEHLFKPVKIVLILKAK